MKLTKKRYLIGFTVAVLVLAAVRVALPAIAEPKEEYVELPADDIACTK